MHEFVAVVLLMLGRQHQTRSFGPFPTEASCEKFTRWQVDTALRQDIESITVCLPESEFREVYPRGVVEEPTT